MIASKKIEAFKRISKYGAQSTNALVKTSYDDMDKFEKYALWKKTSEELLPKFRQYKEMGAIDDGQLGSCAELFMDHAFNGPGRFLQVKQVDEKNSDLIIPKSWVVKGSTCINCHQGHSLRRSIEMTMQKVLAERPDGAEILTYEPDRPRYFCNGEDSACDPSNPPAKPRLIPDEPEIWTGEGHVTSWPAVRIACHVADPSHFTPNSLPLDSDGVVGYYTLLELPDMSYWDRAELYRLDAAKLLKDTMKEMSFSSPTPEQIKQFMKVANADPYEENPDAKGKIIQRSSYLMFLYHDEDLGGWGNFKSDEPDSYIFRGDAIQQSGLRPLHTYRVIVPSLIGQTKKAAPQFKGPPIRSGSRSGIQ